MAGKFWGELTRKDFENIDQESTFVLFPIGSTEQHGSHLPVSNDAISVDAVVRKLMEVETPFKFLVLPTLWCSKSNEHIDSRGTIFLTRETLGKVVLEISASVARSDFQRLVILNWHGGNIDYLTCLARDIRQETGILTFVIDAFGLLISYPVDWLKPEDCDIHAGRFETSFTLATYPELVKPPSDWDAGSDYARGKMANSFKTLKHLSPEGGRIGMGWVTKDLTDDGIIGDPRGANASEGKEYLDYMVDQLCQLLPEIAQFSFR